MNDALLSQIDMQPLESFTFKGANNDDVQGFMVKPPGFDPNKKYPLKFLLHGGPQGAWGNSWTYRWNAELFAATGNYVVVMINFHGSTGYGQKFTDSISGDWGGKPYVDVMKGLDYVEKTYPFIDKNREAALGASYGGYMANWLLGHTNRFKCIVSHDGMFNAESAYGTTEELWFANWEFGGPPWKKRDVYRKWSPHEYAQNFKTPTLVVHGQNDYRLDVSQGFDLFTTLQVLKVPSKMLYFPDEGHWVLKPQNSPALVQDRERLGGSMVQMTRRWDEAITVKAGVSPALFSNLQPTRTATTVFASRTAPLDFLRRLRIKNAVETYDSFLFSVFCEYCSVGLVLLCRGMRWRPAVFRQDSVFGRRLRRRAGWSTA